MVVDVYNPNIQRLRQKHCEYETSLGYILAVLG